jgi:hypothetical protein
MSGIVRGQKGLELRIPGGHDARRPATAPLTSNMKTTSSLLLLAVLSPAALFTTGCTKSASTASDSSTTVASNVQAAASDSWDGIKDYTYEKREDFAAGLDRLAAASDTKISALSADATKGRESAVNEFHDANAQLKLQLTALRASTANTWTDAKAKADAGWQRVKAAYDALMAKPAA